jgi:RHS repeat-associated protein
MISKSKHMRKYSIILIGLLSIICYGQNEDNSGQTTVSKDDFTYKKINVTNNEEGNLSLVGSLNSSDNTVSSSARGSSGKSSIGIEETIGQLSVSLTGSAQYDIPIDVPLGINGIKPEISLSYNSQNGNGIAGYGWNIHGLSTISRIPSTKFHDNQIDAVDFDNLDRFALDGKRLVLKSGTYGGNGAEYETEDFSNIKIISYGVSSYGAAYGPAYFVVNYPDGSVAHYGNSSDSLSRTNYAITYWQNPQGVRISYEYYIEYNTQYIHKIKYGNLTTSTPINEVRFLYYQTNRKEQAYINGNSLNRHTTLWWIEVYSNSVKYKQYSFSYNTTNLGYYRLNSFTERSGDLLQSHSPVTFNYSTTNSSVNYSGITTELTLANIEQRNSDAVSLDLTGNGKMDFIVYPKTKDKFWIFKDIETGAYNFPYEVGSGVFEAIFPTTFLNSQNKVLGGQGLTVVQNGSNNLIDFKVYGNGSTSGTPLNYQYTKSWSVPTYSYQTSPGPLNKITKKIPQEYISGDFNGDGLSDVLAIGKAYETRTCTRNFYPTDYYDYMNNYYSGQYYQTYTSYDEYYYAFYNGNPNHYTCSTYMVTNNQVNFINLKRDISTGFANYAGALQQNLLAGEKILTGDFNGDGKTDIMHVTSGKVFVFSLSNTNTLSFLWQKLDVNISINDPLLLGDYNGDGKTDFLLPTANNSYSFKTFLSTGITFEVGTRNAPFMYKKTTWNPNPTNGLLSGFNLVPVDINGDGKTDIVEYNTTTSNGSTNGTEVITIYNNIGLQATEFIPMNISFVNGGTTSKTGNLRHYPIPIFLSANQPNKNLEFASISDRWVTNFSFTQDHREDVLIRSIVNNGVTHTIDYNNLDPTQLTSNYAQVYQVANNQTYPNIDLQVAPSTKVVTALQRLASGTTTLRQEYSYYGAIFNSEGLGFLGFEGVAQSNWHTGYSDRIFNVTKHNPLLRGTITDEYSLVGAFAFTVPTSNYITKTSYTNGSSISANKVFKTWVSSSLTLNALEGTNTSASYIYDIYNNPTKITTTFLGAGSKVVDLTYANSTGTTYYIGRPTGQLETNTIGGETFTTEKEFIYTGYLLTQLNTKGHATPFDIETYTYDAFGNITKKTVTPNGSTAREIEFQYDTTGRFLIKSIDAEDLETNYQYNVNTGTISKETNPFGQETNYTYDSWNRPLKVIDYLGNDVTKTYVESNNSYTITSTGNDGGGAIQIYDPLKRLTTSKGKDVLGQWVSTSYEYDKFDRPWKTSEPYTGSGASQWNEIEYDLYDRPTKLTEFTGKVTNISYSGLTTTVNDGTKTVITTKNAMGNVVSVTDPGGTINYTYFGNGNLKTANYGGVVVSMEQDGWGRKTKLTDPSAGIYTYTYNGFGELLSETNPKGSTNYTYSPVGKLIQKVITGDNTNMTMQYGYHVTNKLLSSITLASSNGNNASYAYTYDSNHRLTNMSENNAFAEFIKQYSYDAFGRIETEQYYGKLLLNNTTSTKKVKNVYQNGGLKTVQDFITNEVLWNVNALNARGQITTATMGNDLRNQNTYDAYGYLTESKSEKNASTSAIEIMKLTTSFNVQRGILNSRANSMFSWSETFTYDSMDRLVNFNDNNANKNHAYDLLGRITTNSDVGNYAYSGNSYKVNSIDLNVTGDTYYQQNTLQQITYNAFKKPFEISEVGKENIGFQYNAFMERSHMFYGDTQSDILLRKNRKHYSYDGSMEISYDNALNKTIFVTYIGGDAYSSPVIWRSEHSVTPDHNYYYLHRDYLGSILMISDINGTTKEKRHFDAWGNVVKLTDGNGVNLNKFVYLDRGYTGHEHLQGVGLIHMNGRLYDPKLKRFLSPDNYIQDPFSTQNFNRYGYVLNNPLMYVDPSGETAQPGNRHRDEPPGYDYERSLEGARSVPINIDFRGFRNWIGNNVQSGLRDIGGFLKGIGNFIGGIFTRPKGAIVEYQNYQGLTSDPLAGSSTNIPLSYFGGGGTHNGGLGIGNYESGGTNMVFDSNGKYTILYPSYMGSSWGDVGSDGRIYIGCMSCHGNNGAYREAAYGSKARLIGLTAATIFPAAYSPGTRLSSMATKEAFMTKTLAQQADELVVLNGKNSLTLRTPSRQIRYDLAGKSHGNVPTPHIQIYNKNFVNGVLKNVSRASKEAIPMTQKDLRLIRKYLERL